MKQVAQIMILVTMTMALLAGCSKETDVSSLLPGTWYPEGCESAAFILYDDGTCEIAGEYGTGKWSVVNENQLKLENYYGETQIADIKEASDGKLILGDGDNMQTFLKTSSSPDTNNNNNQVLTEAKASKPLEATALMPGNNHMNNYLQLETNYACSGDWVYFNNDGVINRVSRQNLIIEQITSSVDADIDGLIVGNMLLNHNGTVFQIDRDEIGTCFCDMAFGEFATNILPNNEKYYYLLNGIIRSADVSKVVDLPEREYTYNGIKYNVAALNNSIVIFDGAKIEVFGIYDNYIVAIDSNDCIWTIDLKSNNAIMVHDGEATNGFAVRIVAAVDGGYIYYNNEEDFQLERVKLDGTVRETDILSLDGRHNSTFNVSNGQIFYMARSSDKDEYSIY